MGHTSAVLLTVATFVHRIDPVLLDCAGIKLWYYGLAYALGFIGIYLWLRRARHGLGLSLEEVYDLCILFATGALIGGRGFEIVVYELPYYAEHPGQLLSYWHGGMASHGVLLGAVVGLWLFCKLRRRRFFRIADGIVIPSIFFLALGRIGNFINGQIYGRVTTVWWAVRFPGEEVFRHPVTLYESLKNLAIIPILFLVGRKYPVGQGVLLGHFVFWYGFLRLFADHFREYGTKVLGIGTGQYFNLFMAAFGIALILWRSRACPHPRGTEPEAETLLAAPRDAAADSDAPGLDTQPRLLLRKLCFVFLLALSLTIPSSWTQGVLKKLRDSKPASDQLQAPASPAANSSERGPVPQSGPASAPKAHQPP